MGRIKNDVKKAMRLILEYGFEYVADDMGGDWSDTANETHGFTMADLEEAFQRLMKKAGIE